VTESTLDTTRSARDGGPVSSARREEIGPGSVVGRHMVLHEIGAGGMGVVYAAYDPELDRKVALKLVLPGRGATGRVRLLREAQALARLSHPHVVAVHDVGTVGEQIWLAMELVEGRTLSDWLETKRQWRDALEVLRKAGAGLAAAHAVGLLHRDFKPTNVMVGDDDRVRVLDFGLARTHASEGSAHSDPPEPSEAPKSPLTTDLTRTGAVVGTPRYMAPEQLGAKELTAAADQFSFCVTLWEALYGQRPFAGSSTEAIIANVLAGRLRSPPKRHAVPGWLRRACERGLAADPEQRWPSMDALLDTLAKGRKRAGIRKGAAVVAVLALLGAAAEARRGWELSHQQAACDATATELDGVWSPAREQALRKALVATGVSFAPMTADKVTSWIDRQAAQWREARVEACLDANVRGRWDADTLDRSLWCLDARRTELESLVDELTRADVPVVHRAVAVASSLAPVAACLDPEVLETRPPPPPVDREALREIRADVLRAANLDRAGRSAQGLELAGKALARAEALAWPPLVTEARLQRGQLLERNGSYPEAAAELEQAYFDASRGVAPEVVFDAACRLVRTLGVNAAQHADGLHWARLAEVALEELHDGEQLRRASLLTNRATVHRLMGEYHEARREQEQALAILQDALGSEHLRVVATLVNLANVHAALRNDDEAAALLQRALTIQEQVLEPDNPDLSATLNNLAIVRSTTGDHEAAKRLLQRALAISEQALGSTHPSVATSLNNLADEHYAAGDYEEAKRLSERALSIWEQALGPEHPDVAASLINLANATRATGDGERAKLLHERALGILEAKLGPEHPHVAHPLASLAKIALDQHRPADALALAQRAVSIQEQSEAAARELAPTRFVLAQALWATPKDGGGDPARAVTLAEQARDALRAAGDAEVLPELEQWLADRSTSAPPP